MATEHKIFINSAPPTAISGKVIAGIELFGPIPVDQKIAKLDTIKTIQKVV